MHLLTEPFDYGFFLNALIAGILVGALCGALGVFVVLRRMSYIGQGLSQSVLGGVAPAVLAGIDPYLGAAAATIVAGLLINIIGRQHGVRPDAAIGIVSTTMFAAGVALVSANRDRAVNLTDLLFGNILGVTDADIVLVGVVAAVVAVGGFVYFKVMAFTIVDSVAAAAHGVRAATVEFAFTIALAAVVVVSIRVVGVLLIAAVIVIPASTARLVGRSLGLLIAVSTGLGVLAAAVGLFVSFHIEIASGPAIVLASSAAFALTMVATTVTGVLTLRRARVRHSPPR
ncbi:metal ABC transporter permease [Mycobacterium sp. SMC-4]|uniref:metal ABC transporter permease n=1 Tax=Mycobacterium sp. SMC-4 TaxID=2857059 RepID=UPI0021B3F24A|nr:metal ABC transporter permease [Mycobacterium sp. SMC-4]UXA17733.1 metal ABC transporter permease [Mycobacterium sp. SMC-4]